MRLRPGPDLRQPGAEALGHDVVGLADEEREVANPGEALDLADHLGVVVGRQLGLARSTLRRRQPAHEVGEEAVARGLQLRILVQEVVDLPCLVADPEVVAPLAGDIVEEHEVRDEDLVHLTPRLEDRQLVTRGGGRDVGRFAREQ